MGETMQSPSGTIITFYSYKGGTGRSMMLANTAWLLAANGKRVLVIDWDLEAPGLHRYFKPFLFDAELADTNGLIDAFWALVTHGLMQEQADRNPRPLEKLGFASAGVDLEDYISPLNWKFPAQGGIDFVGAGRQGPTYSERVNSFDWKRFYQMGGGSLLERTRKTLTGEYDFVLIDSRTGVSDTSGICTIQMPDVLVACLTLNRQSIAGVASILDSVSTCRNESAAASAAQPRRAITIFPVATRVENAEKIKLDLARTRAREVLNRFIPAAEPHDSRQYWDDMEVTYRPFYAYEEILAAFGDPAGVAGSAKTLLSEMEAIGRRVCGLKNLASPEIPEADRQRILAQYAFGVAQPPMEQISLHVGASDQQDSEFVRGIYAKEALWRSSDFRYAHLLSRRELQLVTPTEKAEFGRQMSFFHSNSELFQQFQDLTIRIFMWVWIAIACFFALQILTLLFHHIDRPDLTGSYSPGLRILTHDLALPVLSGLTVLLPPLVLAGVLLALLAAHRSRLKPYGMRFRDVFRLSLFGPFAADIGDYNPRNATSAGSIAATG
jgi:cellulose biosynthesis protein BcsQ